MHLKAGKRLIIAATAMMLVASAGIAPAAVIQGRVKAVAKDAGVLTLEIEKDKILFLNWNNRTVWKNVENLDLKFGDVLVVDYGNKGDQALAAAVSRLTSIMPAGIKAVSVEKIAASLDKIGAPPPFTLIDTRPVDRFDAAHLPGARSVPLQRIEKRSEGVLPEDRATALVFYDDGAGDGSAAKGAGLALKAGYTDVAIFPEGTVGWVSSGRFLASSSTFIRKGNPVIIDLRTPERVASGHIERAVTIAAATLPEKYGMFPMDRGVPLVLYGETDGESLAAAKTIRQWGYRNVTIFSGGAAAWQAGAEVLTTEPAAEFIDSASASKGGQLRPKDFEMALASPVTVEIVDVRSPDDYRKGHFPRARHIPLQELSARHGELDREMIQVVFGADDVQAEMAADFLKQQKYRVNYLHGRVEFQGDGKYQVK